ncbi:MAG: hypothetical protein JNK63_08375 [Chthonomonas sp.]|nr:hypothetical protein [Chthonomonas sp.]
MQFRRIYWVVEETRQGDRSVRGVFTSVSDLLDRYLDVLGAEKPDSLRLSLVKLDQVGDPLGVWESGQFSNLKQELQQFIESGEFSIDECERLSGRLSSL